MSSELKKVAERAAIEGVTIEVGIDATVKVGDWDFLKPSAKTSVRFSTIPTEEQIRLAMKFMNDEVLNPTMEDVLVEIQNKLRESRKP